MAVLIACDSGCEALLSDEEIADICAFVLEAERVTVPCEVSLSWVDDERMRELNATWRGIDRVTDVLSFECDDPASGADGEEAVELGDIVLAPAQIARQAPGFGNTPEDECRLMLVHGMLHLLGYDHIEDDEAEEMEAREDDLLRALAEGRGEDPAALNLGPLTRHSAEEEGDDA